MHCRMLTESLTSEKTTKVIQSNTQHIPTMPTNQNPIEAAMSPCILEEVYGFFCLLPLQEAPAVLSHLQGLAFPLPPGAP